MNHQTPCLSASCASCPWGFPVDMTGEDLAQYPPDVAQAFLASLVPSEPARLDERTRAAIFRLGFEPTQSSPLLWMKTVPSPRIETVRVMFDARVDRRGRVYAFCDDAKVDKDAIARKEEQLLRVELDTAQRRLTF